MAERVLQSDVLVSAVISTYQLTHLHHVLQRAELLASQEGRRRIARQYAELRRVLCLEARTMDDVSSLGRFPDKDNDTTPEQPAELMAA